MAVYTFRDGAIPAGFTVRTSGNGAVVASASGNGTLELDSGGTASSDCAAVVIGPLDMSKRIRISARMKTIGASMASYSYNMIGLYKGTSTPTLMTTTSRAADELFFIEDQWSTSFPDFSRYQFRFRGQDSGNPLYYFNGSAWTKTGFSPSITGQDRDSYFTVTISINGEASPKTARIKFMGTSHSRSFQGNSLMWDTPLVNFNSGDGSIRTYGSDNVYLVLGDLVNNNADGRDLQYIFDWLEVAEYDSSDYTVHTTTNDAPDLTFPFDYDGHLRVNPSQTSLTLFTQVNRYNEPTWSRGSDHWRKDGRITYDPSTGTFYYIEQIRDDADSLSDIYITEYDSWPPGTPVGGPTLIFSTSDAKDEFPELIKNQDGSGWYVRYGVEESSPTAWRIDQRSTSDANPRTATWGTASTKLTGQAGEWDSLGVSLPITQWWSGSWASGVFILWYYGQSGSSTWRSHFAVSTTGFNGTYSRTSTGPSMSVFSSLTATVNGNQTRVNSLLLNSEPGFTVGDPIIAQQDQLNAITSISANTIGLETKFTLNSGDGIEHLFSDRYGFRAFQRLNETTWVAWTTVFGLPGGQEWAWPVIGTGHADPRQCTWVPGRISHSQIQVSVPSFPIFYNWGSAENPGFVRGPLTPLSHYPVVGTAAGSSSASGVLGAAAAGGMTGTSSGVASASGILRGTGSLLGSSDGTSTAVGTLKGTGNLSGASSGTALGIGTLGGQGALSGVSSGVSTGIGTLRGQGALLGGSSGIASVSGTLKGRGTLLGTAEGTSIGVGGLGGAGKLSGISLGASIASAVLSGSGKLVGSSLGSSTAVGILGGGSALSGTSSGVGSASGVLRGLGRLQGSSSGLSTAVGVLTSVGSGALSGTALGTSLAVGILSGIGRLSGVSLGTSTGSGSLSSLGRLSGTSSGVGSVSGVLRGLGRLSGGISGSCLALGALSGRGGLLGVSAGSATGVGLLIAQGALSGLSMGSSTAVGSLRNAAATYGSMVEVRDVVLYTVRVSDLPVYIVGISDSLR